MSQPQVIQPNNSLRMKIGGSALKGLDASAIEKAEKAIQQLSGQFGAWLQEELTKLDHAHGRIKEEGLTGDAGTDFYLRAHDIKGLGTTYEYPSVTRIAGSLCKLLDDEDKRMKAPMVLVDAHVNAIKACVRDQLKELNNPIAKMLAEEMERQVKAFLG